VNRWFVGVLGVLLMGSSGCATARRQRPSAPAAASAIDPFMAVNNTPTGMAKYFPNLPSRPTSAQVTSPKSRPVQWTFAPRAWFEARHPALYTGRPQATRSAGPAALEPPPSAITEPLADGNQRIRSMPTIEIAAHQPSPTPAEPSPTPAATPTSPLRTGTQAIAAMFRRPNVCGDVDRLSPPVGSRDDAARQTAVRSDEESPPDSAETESTETESTETESEKDSAPEVAKPGEVASTEPKTASRPDSSSGAVSSPVNNPDDASRVLEGRPRLALLRPGSLPPDLPPVTFPSTYYEKPATATAAAALPRPKAERRSWWPRLVRAFSGGPTASLSNAAK
jgi:hypothetical protein